MIFFVTVKVSTQVPNEGWIRGAPLQDVWMAPFQLADAVEGEECVVGLVCVDLSVA